MTLNFRVVTHLFTVRDFALHLTSIARFNESVSISVNRRPIKSGIENLLGRLICSVMFPGGSIMTSGQDIIGFRAMNTTSDYLIGTNTK